MSLQKDFLSVTEASEAFGYCASHIRNLLSRGIIAGEKFANVWMVDRRSIERYQVAMEQLGQKKHGLWATEPVPPSDGSPAQLEENYG